MPHVLVIGAGYAGVHAARTAAAGGADVTVLDPLGRHELLPRLAAVAAGRRDAGDAWVPLEDLGCHWLEGRATRVDPTTPDAPRVTLEDGRTVVADAVVVTVGGRPALPGVPGLDRAEARTLARADDALRLRHELDDASRLVVVGGGATGVQLAAETAVTHPDVRVTLVEGEPVLLPGLPGPLGRHAERVLRQRGVDVRPDTVVARADARGVVLSDGRRVDGLVVWATGTAGDVAELLPWAAVRDGRAVVDPELRIAARVLAAGDAAVHRDLLGSTLAPSAQVALQAGRAAGSNAARIAAGRRPRPARLLDLGWIVDLGGHRGVGAVGPVRLAAPLVDRVPPLLHELVDVGHLLRAGGPRAALGHAPGRHHPDARALRRAERPGLHSVG